MEHSFAATLAALFITGSVVFGFFALENGFKPKENEIPAKTEISVPEETETEKAVLGVFEGRLALFKGKSPYPNIVYDFYVRNLPKEDQNRLYEGILISDEKELKAVLEDFMS